MHNEYFCHNEPHNDAPSVSVQAGPRTLVAFRLRVVYALLTSQGGREAIAREVKIGLPLSILGRARSDRSDTALSSTDCLRKHSTHGERRRGGLRCAAIT